MGFFKKKKVKEFFKDKKILKAGILALIIAFIFLGSSIKWDYNSKDGLSCDGNYTPPNPDDVNKIIKLRDKAPKKVKQ